MASCSGCICAVSEFFYFIFYSKMLAFQLKLINTLSKEESKDASGCLAVLHIMTCTDASVHVCVPNSVSLFFLTLQQKDPNYRWGIRVPFDGLLPWTPSQGHTSLASGLGTPMDPTLPAWKTKPHRYTVFRKSYLGCRPAGVDST